MTPSNDKPSGTKDGPTPNRRLPDGFERATSRSGENKISYLVGGHGPPLVLLHGWPQTALAWTPVLPALASAGHTVIAPDLSGTGQSEELADSYHKDTQAAALRTLLNDLGIGGPIHVIGHDIGGMIAFSWARKHPEEVARLALTSLPKNNLNGSCGTSPGS